MILLQEKNKYSCEEHLDMAFDDFLLENEESPCLLDTDDNKCDYCENKAKYKLTKCNVEQN